MKKLFLAKDTYLNIKVADNFWTRLCGLLGTKYLLQNEGLLIKPCNSVHMMGMQYAIDIVYIDKQSKIIKIVENLKPWFGVSVCFKAEIVLELAQGAVKYYNFQLGQKINIED